MLKTIILAASIVALPTLAMAQTQAPAGAAAGAATGAVGGAIIGGPVGAAVGAVGGAIVGGIAGSTQPEFRTYVVEQKPTVYKWNGKVAVGETLPGTGVTCRRNTPRRSTATRSSTTPPSWSIPRRIASCRSSSNLISG